MKHLQIILLVGILTLVFSSCHEITVKTKINEDGSFTRTIIINGEKKEDLFKASLPYPVDNSWIAVESYDSSNTEKPYVLTYSKDFSSIKEMDITVSDDSNHHRFLDRSIDIYKRQGFFYSYLVFEENISSINPYPYLDYHDYLSDEELMYLKGAKAETDSLTEANLNSAGEKAMIFLEESISTGIMEILKEGISTLNISSVNVDIVDRYGDSICALVREFEIEDQVQYIDSLAKWSNNEEILKLKKIQPPIFEESDQKMSLFSSSMWFEEYTQIVELPGLLTETNSFSPVGNTVSWKVDPITYVVDDFTMYAESRIVNVWAFVLAGICVLLLIGFLLFKSFKK